MGQYTVARSTDALEFSYCAEKVNEVISTLQGARSKMSDYNISSYINELQNCRGWSRISNASSHISNLNTFKTAQSDYDSKIQTEEKRLADTLAALQAFDGEVVTTKTNLLADGIMAAYNFSEGFLKGFENILDGLMTGAGVIVGFFGWDSAEAWLGDFVERDLSDEYFDQVFANAPVAMWAEKYASWNHDDPAADVFMGAGTVMSYVAMAVVTGGALSGVGGLTAVGANALANGLVTGLGTWGSETEDLLENSDMTISQAGLETLDDAIVAGLAAGGTSYLLGNLATSYIGSTTTALVPYGTVVSNATIPLTTTILSQVVATTTGEIVQEIYEDINPNEIPEGSQDGPADNTVDTTDTTDTDDTNDTDDTTDTDDTNDNGPTDDGKKDDSTTDNRQDDSTKDDSTKDDSTKDDNTKDDSTKDDNTKDDSTKDDSTKDDSTKDDSTKDDSTKDDSTKDDSTKDDSTKDDSAKDDDNKDKFKDDSASSFINDITDNNTDKTVVSITDDFAGASFEEIIDTTSSINIPTSSNPIKSTLNKDNNMIPLMAGLGAAALSGLGTKAYLDRKENKDNEEELEAEEWQEDEDLSLENENYDLDIEEKDYLTPDDEFAYQPDGIVAAVADDEEDEDKYEAVNSSDLAEFN